MPSSTEKQRRYMAAARERKRKGKPAADDPRMSMKKFRDFVKKTKKRGG